MSLWQALILGIIQGLTEFLPVSSSGHLELAKYILGNESVPEKSLLFTVVVHFATAMSTIFVFRKDIADIISGLLKFQWNESTKFSLKIIISMIPAAVIGLAFNKQIEMLFSGQILLVGFMLILTGLLLFLADKASNTNKKVSNLNALIIGFAQAIAIIPGISRSGATISTSVLLKIDRSKAARFSFLMVLPLIIAKMMLDLAGGEVTFTGEQSLNLLAGFITAFFAGLFACKWMVTLVKKAKLNYFALYCFIIGSLAIFFSA